MKGILSFEGSAKQILWQLTDGFLAFVVGTDSAMTPN